MNFGSPASTEKKGYAKVSKDEDVGSGQDLNPEDVEYWTVSEVGDYLRKRLLEFEGADAETVNELVSTFEAREVDGQTLLGLDDLQLRYELDIGAVVVRETLMRIIKGLRAASKRAAPNKGKKERRPARRPPSDETDSSEEDDERHLRGGPLRGSGRGRERSWAEYCFKLEVDPDEGDESPAARERRRKRAAKKKKDCADLELKTYVRVAMLASFFAVLYGCLAAGLDNWHTRDVSMHGEGEFIHLRTSLGLFTFASRGHYHNQNMYANAMPDAKGFEWEDDYEVEDTYEASKWQCKPPVNKAVKEFCGAIRAAQTCMILAILCATACLAQGFTALWMNDSKPAGCSRVLACVSVCEAGFSVAAALFGDTAITAQLQRYGDKSITPTECNTHYLAYTTEPDDDWYDDDWGYKRMANNDDHFTVADVSCGYSVAFILNCFVPFLALVQAVCFVRLRMLAPRSGDFGGTPKQYVLRKKGSGNSVQGPPGAHGGGKPKRSTDKKGGGSKKGSGSRGSGANAADERGYDAYAADADKYGDYDADDFA